jgi:hypothetical protein
VGESQWGGEVGRGGGVKGRARWRERLVLGLRMRLTMCSGISSSARRPPCAADHATPPAMPRP